MKILLTLVGLTLTATLTFAQNIQWANSVYHSYNIDKNSGYSDRAILGAPDTRAGSTSNTAVKLVTEKGFGSIIVEFKQPEQVKHIVIVESHHPGNIVNVHAVDEDGLDYKIYKSHAHKTKDDHRVTLVHIPETDYKVRRVQVDINTGFNAGWAQLDAIGISTATVSEVKKELDAIDSYTYEEVQGLTSQREALSEIINTRYDEVNPIISQDGQTLYFTRAEDPANTGGHKDYGDIYFSKLINNRWSTPVNLGEPLNNNAPNGLSSLSTDGNSMLLINAYRREDIDEGIDLSQSHRTEGGWDVPSGVKIEGLKNDSDFVDYSIASSGNVMILSIENYEGFGDQDLYVSFRNEDNSWTKPKNLGNVVNTSGADFSPFLASDGKTLYFSSLGRQGFGDADIYYSKRDDNSWENWSKPVNMGEGVNTTGFDGYYSITADGHSAYYVSDYGGIKNSRDIYRITLDKKFKPEPVLFISGKVYNKLTNRPIKARIVFEILENGKEEGVARTDPATGDYKIILPTGYKYAYYAEADGFMAENANIDNVSGGKFTELHKDLYMVPIENNRSLIMKNIFFETAKWRLLPDSFHELNRLVDMLKINPDITIEISGHTDDTGTDETNDLLSLRRANAVMGYLTTKGIEDKRMTADGKGSRVPIATNDTESGRAENRRVEVKFIIK